MPVLGQRDPTGRRGRDRPPGEVGDALHQILERGRRHQQPRQLGQRCRCQTIDRYRHHARSALVRVHPDLGVRQKRRTDGTTREDVLSTAETTPARSVTKPWTDAGRTAKRRCPRGRTWPGTRHTRSAPTGFETRATAPPTEFPTMSSDPTAMALRKPATTA